MVRAGCVLGLVGMLAGVGSLAAQKGVAVGKVAAKPAVSRDFEVITPVFHQLVAFSIPAAFDFSPAEQVNGKSYLRETVLRGETPERWTQMITLSGAQGSVAGGLTAQHMAEAMGGGYQHACPKSFAFKDIGGIKISGQPAYLGLVSCGSVADANGEPGARHSETALLVVIQGDEDMYTLQWAERGAASETALPFEDAKWQGRFRTLQPIRVCARVAGEKAPYASCLTK